MKSPCIVFCTTCKGRTQHIKDTLPFSLRDNADYENCKFFILDYGDSGELAEYLRANHQPDIESGRVVVYRYFGERTPQQPMRRDFPFEMAHAKNLAARCGMLEGADILVTLDADNSTGPGFAQFIANLFREPGIFLCPDFRTIHATPHGPQRPLRGYAGRLAIRAQDFIKLGGYDENFTTWQGEDIDLLARLRRLNYTERYFGNHFLKVIPHGAEVRFAEYPDAQKHEKKGEFNRLENRKETVVNNGNFGVGKVYRNFGTTPVMLGHVPTRIFGIGMQRTATTSLDRAFKILGFDSLHWGTGEAARIWHEMQALGRSPTLERFYAVSDNPMPLLYKQLDALYPGSKFILTIRDRDKWLASVERLWDPKHNPARWIWDKYPITNRIHKAIYGRTDFNAKVFLRRYLDHNIEVLEYFRGREQDLLEIDIEAGDRWPELCEFLSVPVPPIPFPLVSHTSKEVTANEEY